MRKEQFKVIHFRGSIFTPAILYNNDNLSKMMSILCDYTPSTDFPISSNGFPIQMSNAMYLPNPIPAWRMNSNDGRVSVSFLEQKIDVTINVIKLYEEGLISALSKECLEIFEKIVESFGLTISRMAIAPSFGYIINMDELEEFSREKFTETFKGASIGNATYNKVYRHPEMIGGKEYTINYLANVTNGSFTKPNGNNLEIRDTLNIDFDINTFQDPAYSFDKVSMIDFFNNAPEWQKDYCDFILNK